MDNNRTFNLETISQLLFTSVLLAIMICAFATDDIRQEEQFVEEISIEEEIVLEDTIEKEVSKPSTYVHMTCYQPVKAQCNIDPLHTADGSKIDLKRLKNGNLKWIAISRDLESMFPMGSKVRIIDEKTGKDYGIYEVKDRMNKRWRHRIDILVHPSSKEKISKKCIKIELV